MGEYTVRIVGEGATPALDFTFAAEVNWRDLERLHRTDQLPNLLAVVRREITITAELPDDTPAAVRAALASLMADHLSKNAVPVGVQIRDPGGIPIPDLGEIVSSGAPNPDWQDVQVTRFEVDSADPGQLRARLALVIAFVGDRLFVDSNGQAFVEQELTSTGAADFRLEETLTSTVRVPAPGDAAAVNVAAMRLPAPPGKIRVAPSNNVLGISVRYPKWPRKDEAVVTSTVLTLAGGVVLPAGAGDGSVIDRERLDPRLGLLVKTLRAEITGSTAPRDFVDGEDPGDGVKTLDHDRARNQASAEYEQREVVRQIDKAVHRVRLTWVLNEGGGAITETLLTGGFFSQLRRGPRRRFSLVETVEVFALNPEDIEQFPVPALLDDPWVFNPGQSTFGPPQIFVHGGEDNSKQHIWRISMTRFYRWNGSDDPRKEGQNRLVWLDQWLDTAPNRELVDVQAMRGSGSAAAGGGTATRT